MKKITAYLLAVVMALALAVPVFGETAVPNGEKIVYGTSGEGRELCAYRYGSGKNVLVVGFAIHGYEDAFPQDGLALVYTAERVMEYLQTSYLPGACDWTVYILPCMNPDGLYSGWTNNGPGRCTTTMLDENHQLVYGTGIDMNRCFPPMSAHYYSSRNYNGSRPMSCKEAIALANFIQAVKGGATNILIDVHGWLSQNITSSSRISGVLRANFPNNSNSWSNGGSGYLINYAYNLGYETALLELPWGVSSLEQYQRTDYADRVINCVAGLMQTEPVICASVGHVFERVYEPVSCTQDGKEGVICTVCGATSITVVHAPGHTPLQSAIVMAVEATATNDGLYLFTCANCGAEHLAASIPRAFYDVDASAYYAPALDYCYASGIIGGVAEGTFGGELTLSRGMLVTMLYRYEGQPQVGAVSGFADVEPGAYYYDAVNWAVANGVVTGMSAERFAPNEAVTREQAVTIFHRYVCSKGLDNGARAGMGFADLNRLQSYAYDAAAWAVANGIIQGMDGNRLAPQETANRAQSVTILKRVADYVSAVLAAQ